MADYLRQSEGQSQFVKGMLKDERFYRKGDRAKMYSYIASPLGTGYDYQTDIGTKKVGGKFLWWGTDEIEATPGSFKTSSPFNVNYDKEYDFFGGKFGTFNTMYTQRGERQGPTDQYNQDVIGYSSTTKELVGGPSWLHRAAAFTLKNMPHSPMIAAVASGGLKEGKVRYTGKGYAEKSFGNVYQAQSRLYKANLLDAQGGLNEVALGDFFTEKSGRRDESIKAFNAVRRETSRLRKAGVPDAVLDYDIVDGVASFYYSYVRKDSKGELIRDKKPIASIKVDDVNREDLDKILLAPEAGILGDKTASEFPYYKLLGNATINAGRLDAVMRHMFLTNSLNVSPQSFLMFNKNYVI